MGVKWYLSVVLIYICLMTNNVEHLIMGLLAIYLSIFSHLVARLFVVEL